MADLDRERKVIAEQLKKFDQAVREIHAFADMLHKKMEQLHQEAKATRERARAARRRAEARGRRENLSAEAPVQPQKGHGRPSVTIKKKGSNL